MTPGSVVVQLDHVGKSYGNTNVVDDLSLQIAASECFGLLGPNGAGKTTTLRMLLGHTRPDTGTIRVLGRDIPRQAREARTRIGLVPQKDNLDPDFSVRENLRTYASYFAIPSHGLNDYIDELLHFAALEQKADARIGTLSGGMQRRLVLARALINRPDLVVLDEPSTGLDPQARHLIWRRLADLTNRGNTLILTTHYMEEAQRLCDRLAIMDHGRILEIGRPSELITRHIEPHVIEVFGAEAERWAQQIQGAGRRVEFFGETAFCYVHEERPVLETLLGRAGLQYLHRPANLEDVFLKLTGRELRD